MSSAILEALDRWSKSQSDVGVWSFLDDKGNVNDSYTYAQLERATTSLAYYLKYTCGLNSGDRVLLVFFPGLSFTASLLACFKAGVIAVPTFPPDPRKLKKDLHHFISIQSSSGSKVVLTHSQYNFAKNVAELKNMFSSGSGWPDLKWIQVDDILSKAKTSQSIKFNPNQVLPSITENNIAFLQYTSGSTSEPKGVMITHRNLSHNLKIIIHELKADQSTINLSWLPQYHDMGLIGSYLGLLYCGGQGFYISPISFLKDPMLWIRSMSKHRASHTQAPNFAYALVVRKFKEKQSNGQGIDLSSLKHMINAAEPVDSNAVISFYETFAPYGLPSNVLKPTYGLAEHTVFVCSGGSQILTLSKEALEQGNVQIIGESTSVATIVSASKQAKQAETSLKTQEIVGCGYPGHENDVVVRIVDPETTRILPADRVGEIWVSSPSKADGYWGLPELTAEDFHARIVDESLEMEYVRTGDLGFLYQGELFICGRRKDLIIIRGSNHYPQDIERTAERASSSIRAGCSAAFAIRREQDDSEAMVYIAELKENIAASEYANIVSACRLAISKEHGVAVTCLCLIATRTIPKTTSGKIARSWCRREYLAGSLSIVYRWDAAAADLALVPDADSNFPPAVIPATSDNQDGNIPAGDLPSATEEEIRQMDKSELLSRLEATIVQVASSGPSPISPPIDSQSPLTALGLDSLTLVQFKGALENQFYCADIPDEFMFTNICTLDALTDAVKLGRLTDTQKQMLEAAKNEPGVDGEVGAVVVNHKEHACPWFVWCCP
jgi:acyl-CoA synthetase (AMP-forming)/AMP-acid ligase II/acyl carrier protein